MYAVARYCTSPDMIKFACKHGIKQNPMYMKCDDCLNQNFCEIYFRNTPAPKLSPQEKELVNKTYNDLHRKKKKRTLADKWKEAHPAIIIFFVLIIISWLMS